MLTPDQFKNIDDFILTVNKMKLCKHSCNVLAYDQWVDDEESANEFLKLWQKKTSFSVGEP